MTSSRSGSVLRLVLVGAAIALAVGFMARRQLDRQRRDAETAQRIVISHRLTPWEYMARGQSHSFLQRNIGKLQYPGAVFYDDAEHPVEIFFTTTDKAPKVANYYSKKCGLKVTKTGESKAVKYEANTSVKDKKDNRTIWKISIQVSPTPTGATIRYAWPDLRPPTGQTNFF